MLMHLMHSTYICAQRRDSRPLTSSRPASFRPGLLRTQRGIAQQGPVGPRMQMTSSSSARPWACAAEASKSSRVSLAKRTELTGSHDHTLASLAFDSKVFIDSSSSYAEVEEDREPGGHQ